MADRLATGILLVGGASERFGSPKALAPFRGETLAERAWRILEETCDEVVAVGKTAEGLDLPFPVVDDGSDERAPVFGLIAGLRAATHETCLALPVDCPLVTPELLRMLLDAGAVPHTGPLPGVYTRSMLADLESRVAAGELSLRGVNAATHAVDEKQLLNVNTRADLIAATVVDWASERADVRAALLVGSQARSDVPADRWSDLDLALIADDPDVLAADASWIEEFGPPVLTFLEPTAFGGRVERRVLYETGEEVDFALLEASAWRQFVSLPEARVAARRGYRVLYDELGLEAELTGLAAPEESWPPEPAAFKQLTNDFWYHALWTAKKLRRGEVLTALGSLVRLLLSNTVTLLAWHAKSVDPTLDTWHGTRLVERWADPGALAGLERAFPHYDVRDVARALWETIDLFQMLEEETARRLGFETQLDHADLRRRVSEVVRDPRHGATL